MGVQGERVVREACVGVSLQDSLAVDVIESVNKKYTIVDF